MNDLEVPTVCRRPAVVRPLWLVALISLQLLLTLVPTAGHSGSAWPVTEFEVFEGNPATGEFNTARLLAEAMGDDDRADLRVRASVPLTLAFKQAI